MVQPAPTPAMDEVTFKSDTVLSDVHLYTPNQRHLMVRLNGMGQPVFLSHFKLLWSQDLLADSGVDGGVHRDIHTEGTLPSGTSPPGSPPGSEHGHEDFCLQTGVHTAGQEGAGAQLDEDGDLDVVRRPRASSDLDPTRPSRDKVHPVILRQEEDDVTGDEAQESSLCSVIRIGVAGRPAPGGLHPVPTGPPPGMHRARARGRHGARQHRHSHRGPDRVLYSPSVIPDVGADLLAMCQRNVALNDHLTAARGGIVKVRELDWLKDDLCTDPEVPFSWSEEEISNLYNHTTVLLAAEVFYDDDLTDALFRTVYRLTHKLKNACTVILSVEKRLNFTLRHLDVTCEAYDHFRASLHALEKLASGKVRFTVEPVEAAFPQRLAYERIQQLELWKIIVEPVT
ncbi:methyltransferase-like protein 22 isoform X2 [Loxodonta africana]|uniref:methyltransferase-like protein 22 isoform X2 n=1 Tax=Loxodonta africana TaxID=9785 RepID=UPI000C8115EF|nr:methyltransferase-like protein 22 isoform X2 [Loxodonta africana]